MSRPEHIATADVYYNEEISARYARNTRNIEIQSKMTERALELLALPESSEPQLILDLGCGSGLSSEIINEHGHVFIGVDLSRDMLNEALDRDVTEGGDIMQGDMGQGIPGTFRVGTFDGCISISVLQWLLSADNQSEAHHKLRRLFSGLHKCLKRGARAVFQFYPETADQIELITSCALRAGFGGGLIVDFPNSTKAKKHYLVLHAGFSHGQQQQQKEQQQQQQSVDKDKKVRVESRTVKKKNGKKVIVKKSREWVIQKKDRQARQGKEVRPTSKYTGRKRRGKF